MEARRNSPAQFIAPRGVAVAATACFLFPLTPDTNESMQERIGKKIGAAILGFTLSVVSGKARDKCASQREREREREREALANVSIFTLPLFLVSSSSIHTSLSRSAICICPLAS